MADNERLHLLLNEVRDEYSRENFWRLKRYIDECGIGGNTGNTSINRSVTNVTQIAPETSDHISRIMDCAVTVMIDDWVFHSESQNNFAVTSVNNTEVQRVIGKVFAKPTPTTCEVVVQGLFSEAIGRGPIYLGLSGESTLTCPQTGYLHKLGFSYGDGKIIIQPEAIRVKRS